MTAENNPRITERVSDFRSQDLRCAGTLVLPDGIEKPPAVIMGHGFAAERSFRLPQFAADFAAAGYAVYYFDYRNFGGSEGQPRHWVDPTRHQQDWRAAIAHVKSLPVIDPDRVVIWGSSFGGGHVLQIASEGVDIAAVISQVPHVSGLATLRNVPMTNLLKGSAFAVLDIVGAALLRKPHYSPVIGRPGSFAAMSSPECWEGYFGIVPTGAHWENKVLSRVFLKLALFSPIRQHALRWGSFITCLATTLRCTKANFISAIWLCSWPFSSSI